MFGRTKRVAREVAHEVLKPIGLDLNQLKEESRRNFEAEVQRVVRSGREDELVNSQQGNRRDEDYDGRHRHSMKKADWRVAR